MAKVFTWVKKHPTTVFGVACLLLVIGVLLMVANTRSSSPTTLAGVTEEVHAGIEEIANAVPPDAVTRSVERSTTEPCPDGTAGMQVNLTRTIDLDPTFDGVQWLMGLQITYDAKDHWSTTLVNVSTNDRWSLTLVGRPLIIYKVAAGVPEVTHKIVIRASSRCSAE